MQKGGKNADFYSVKADTPNLYCLGDSEVWHGMALETSATFLPSECPLVSHIIMSFQKHHAPSLTAIPEHHPLDEPLKVLRPLNNVKSDQTNYHQILRVCHQQTPPKAGCHQSVRKVSKHCAATSGNNYSLEELNLLVGECTTPHIYAAQCSVGSAKQRRAVQIPKLQSVKHAQRESSAEP